MFAKKLFSSSPLVQNKLACLSQFNLPQATKSLLKTNTLSYFAQAALSKAKYFKTLLSSENVCYITVFLRQDKIT
jgi:hypothetical protein